MRKLLASVLLVCVVCFGTCYADDIVDVLKKLPPMKSGVMYNVQDSKITYLQTMELASYKNVSLEAGYSVSDDVVAVMSYKIASLKDLGVNIPVLDLVEFRPGIACGYSRVNSAGGNNFIWGASLTLIEIKK